jgi:predicted ferric reductase
MLEYLDRFAPVIACMIIIFIHAILISPPKIIQKNHSLEHRCIVCAYILFMFHYLTAS